MYDCLEPLLLEFRIMLFFNVSFLFSPIDLVVLLFLSSPEARIIGVCVWQTKKKLGNMLYYWARLVQTHDQLIECLLSNASRGSNGSEPVCLYPFCALIG